MAAMTPRDRVWATLRGDQADRPPVSFWGHVYHRESSADDLVDATLERFETFAWDWIKLNPRKHYQVEDWGVQYRYSGRPNEKPVRQTVAVREPADWLALAPLDPRRGALGEQIEAVAMLRARLPAAVPIIETVFTPLAVLGELVEGPAFLQRHLREHPDEVTAALDVVTRTFEAFVAQVLRAGADGIYLATTSWATSDWITSAELARFARPHDLRVLAAAAGAPFNVLHVCKPNALLQDLADYPVRAFSFDATDPTNPTLARALDWVSGAVMGGISHEDALQQADDASVVAEVGRALLQTGGRRWLAAPGCSIAPTTPDGNLHAVRRAVCAWAEGSGAPDAEAWPQARGT